MNVAVLFTDIVNFTQLSEKMNPSDVLVLLSDYQSIMVEAIFEHNGTVDKFIGDAVMANFGTPKSYGNDAQNAFDCAVAMNVKLDNLNKKRKQANQFIIEHRIGIHYGTCVVGNMGSKQRVEFAVIGDTVNVASRICSACKEFDTNFLISDELAQMINYDLPSKKISDYLIRGRNEPLDLVKIYQ
jgi:adenylate cyclase